MDIVLTIDCVAIALFAGFCVAVVIPACNASVFRYRLWRLRDRIADEIRADGFQDRERPEMVLKFVEHSIEFAPDVNVFKLLVVGWSCRHLEQPTDPFQLDELSRDDRTRIEHHLGELSRLSLRHVLLDSPSGWLVIGLLAPLAVFASLLDRRGHDEHERSVFADARRRVRHEVDPVPALIYGHSDRPPRYSLSHMV
jgi:hypothetical protein